MFSFIDWEIITGYAFIVVALGTLLLSMVAGAVGCITVLKGQSLIGDAIGHSSFPGVVLAFMLFSQRNSAILLTGAVVAGAVAFILIQVIGANSKLNSDAILAVTLSSFFGLGMVLKSYIQGNAKYIHASQAGLQTYIFGQAAYISQADIKIIFVVAIICLLLVILFYKEIKVFVFDGQYSKTIGINSTVLYGVILLCAMSIIGTGLKLVGTILISSLLIVPAITALQWSNRFSLVMIISAFVGGISSVIGTYISTAYAGMSTGPTIITVMSIFALISLVAGPRGIIQTARRRRSFK